MFACSIIFSINIGEIPLNFMQQNTIYTMKHTIYLSLALMYLSLLRTAYCQHQQLLSYPSSLTSSANHPTPQPTVVSESIRQSFAISAAVRSCSLPKIQKCLLNNSYTMSNPHQVFLPVAIYPTNFSAQPEESLSRLPDFILPSASLTQLSISSRASAFSKYKPEKLRRKRKTDEQTSPDMGEELVGKAEYFRLRVRKVNWQEMDQRSEQEETHSSLPHYYDPNHAPLIDGNATDTPNRTIVEPYRPKTEVKTMVNQEPERIAEEGEIREQEKLMKEVVIGQPDDPFYIVKRYFVKVKKEKIKGGKHKQIRKQYASGKAEATDVSTHPREGRLLHSEEEYLQSHLKCQQEEQKEDFYNKLSSHQQPDMTKSALNSSNQTSHLLAHDL